jgi:hypothetical protein
MSDTAPHRTASEARIRHVVVLLRRPPLHPRTAQGLRATVGYLLADLRITLVLGGPAAALLDVRSPGAELLPLLRHISTLQALGHRVLPASEVDLCALLADADAAVAW